MKTFTQDEIRGIIRDHALWVISNGVKGKRANLSEANLRNAYLNGADLRGAYLRGADLRGADLRGAYLRGANLRGADLRGAYLRGADLSFAKINYPIVCPEEGSFIGFKKAIMLDTTGCHRSCVVKLEIPADALRSSATSRKCRCSKAKVLSITNLDGTDADIDVAYSNHDPDFIYKIGEIVEVPDFDTDRWNECSTGIHFFITRQEAVEY